MMRRIGFVLWGAGLLGTATLMLAPLEAIMPPDLDMAPYTFRLITMINPLILVTLAVWLGVWAAPKTGLDAPVIRAIVGRQPTLPVLRRQIGPAILVGAITAAAILGFDAYIVQALSDTAPPDFAMPLVTKLAYGGIVEEIITRWGLMAFLAWLGWRLMGRPESPRAGIFAVAAGLAALIFAAGHLPILYSLYAGPPASLVTAVLIGNAVPGFLFGLLFWKRGLEAAMIAHALAHLFSTIAGHFLG